MIRWPRRVLTAATAMIVLVLGAALVRPLAAQNIGEIAAPPAPATQSGPAGAQSADTTGPRVRQDLPRVEPRLADHEFRAPMMKKKDEFISVSTAVLVLLVAIVVILLVK